MTACRVLSRSLSPLCSVSAPLTVLILSLSCCSPSHESKMRTNHHQKVCRSKNGLHLCHGPPALP
eukprot:3007300-Rhodomonas_salina.1